MIEEKEIQKTLLYIGDEGEVSRMSLLILKEKHFGQLKRPWLKCLMLKFGDK